MSFLEQFCIGSRQVGEDLIRSEAEKFSLGNSVDVDSLLDLIDEVGASFGLRQDTKTKQVIEGANAARGALNERVRGFQINKP